MSAGMVPVWPQSWGCCRAVGLEAGLLGVHLSQAQACFGWLKNIPKSNVSVIFKPYLSNT